MKQAVKNHPEWWDQVDSSAPKTQWSIIQRWARPPRFSSAKANRPPSQLTASKSMTTKSVDETVSCVSYWSKQQMSVDSCFQMNNLNVPRGVQIRCNIEMTVTIPACGLPHTSCCQHLEAVELIQLFFFSALQVLEDFREGKPVRLGHCSKERLFGFFVFVCGARTWEPIKCSFNARVSRWIRTAHLIWWDHPGCMSIPNACQSRTHSWCHLSVFSDILGNWWKLPQH